MALASSMSLPRAAFALASRGGTARLSAASSVLCICRRAASTSAPRLSTAADPSSSSSSSASKSADPAPARALASETKLSKKEEEMLQTKWTPLSVRTGVIARKKGMTALWSSDGTRIPVTVLQLEHNQVTAVRTPPSATYTALQVAATDIQARLVTAQMVGHFAKSGVGPKKKVMEFRVSPDAVVPVGTTITASHFVPGQTVDVRAITTGKGFQGVMKRWGFKGLKASHGVSITHRSQGSTGQHQDPGRVFPGKKMAGRMGGTSHVTVQNLPVIRVDNSLDLLFVKGSVPGPDDGYVRVTDALKELVLRGKHAALEGVASIGGPEGNKPFLPEGVDDLPFPVATRELTKRLPVVIQAAPKPSKAGSA